MPVLLPLGSYTREQPRRPKGGPDGARDIEAFFQGTILVWGAVGFRNGGGRDEESRKWAEQKFKDDLDGALREKPNLRGFVFFTNVDLTPTRCENLCLYGRQKGVKEVAIFDFERLRHVLDSPEGLIVRLQYLDIEMSKEEQLGLIHKFGEKLHSVMSSRFDRVESTLVRMERFLDFQKPILRVDIYVERTSPLSNSAATDQAILLELDVFHTLFGPVSFLCVNHPERDSYSNPRHSGSGTRTYWWGGSAGEVQVGGCCPNYVPNLFTSHNRLFLYTCGGSPITIADLGLVRLRAYCTNDIRENIRRIIVDVNGYEMFSCEVDGGGPAGSLSWPEKLPYDAKAHQWTSLLRFPLERNLLFYPLEPSTRFSLPGYDARLSLSIQHGGSTLLNKRT